MTELISPIRLYDVEFFRGEDEPPIKGATFDDLNAAMDAGEFRGQVVVVTGLAATGKTMLIDGLIYEASRRSSMVAIFLHDSTLDAWEKSFQYAPSPGSAVGILFVHGKK